MKRHRTRCDAWSLRDKRTVFAARLQQTLESKYGPGVTNPIHIAEARKKKSATMRERYGAENPFSKDSSLFHQVQSTWDGKDRTAHLPKDNFARPEVKELIRQHWRRTHGVDNASQVPDIRSKQLQTNTARYGDEHVLRVPEIRAKGAETLQLRYGVANAAQSEEIRARIQATNMARYGVPWTTLGECREKQYNTQIQRYGTRFFASPVGKEKVKAGLASSENTPKDGVRRRPASLNKFETTVQQLCPGYMFTGNGTFWKYLPDFLGSKNPDFIFPGPDPAYPFRNVNRVIECLGVYWHGHERTGLDRTEYESQLISAYAAVGIKCLPIWEDEIWGDLDVLQEKIRLFSSQEPIQKKSFHPDITFQDLEFGRDDSPDVFSFLSEYHYAGFGRGASISYTMRYNGMLIAVAKMSAAVRQTVAPSLNVDANELIELDRFCIHPDFHLKNLASHFMSRVLKSMKRDLPHVRKVVSFADPSEGHVGTIYRASNWTEVGRTSHSYFYLLPNGVKLNKKTLFNKAKSARMHEREYAASIQATRVSTSPKIKFVFSLR